MSKSYLEVLTRASSFLEDHGKEGHAIEYLFLARKNWDKTTWLLNMRKPISSTDEALIETDLAELMKDVPPQYLLGYEEFYGHRFKVTNDTLIPRPETEELVALCLADNPQKDLKVTDIGTGTGVIAISLKLAQPSWRVTALDISTAALEVAKTNAESLSTEVHFKKSDVLAALTEKQDIIISNPPYISADEWELMDVSVRKFEPKQALFADNQGLAIYQRIAEQAPNLLNPQGKIYLEIGFQQRDAVKAIFQKAFPKKEVSLKKDMSGLDRMIVVK